MPLEADGVRLKSRICVCVCLVLDCLIPSEMGLWAGVSQSVEETYQCQLKRAGNHVCRYE